ncbi:MAG: patatin family protein [Paraprevotella sp.]|nr:patatin family protein [Paraprevotella sp.]
MIIDDNTGLVLEGGGMRGVFTCGVLDYLLDRQIYFPYVVGVSAGACNGLSYMSRQRGRARYSNIDMLEKYRFISWRNVWSQHSILDQKLLYKDFPERIVPYDMETYRANPAEFEMVTTNCLTGKACYLSERTNWNRLLRIARATSSLPYVCPVVIVDRQPMLDGGIVDSIPVLHAMERGYKFNVVVLTRHRGYRKTERDLKIPRFFYRRFPRLRVVLSHRCECYNRQLELVERLEDNGDILVIRPEKEVQVDRMETDVKKLTDLYEEGLRCAERALSGVEVRIG